MVVEMEADGEEVVVVSGCRRERKGSARPGTEGALVLLVVVLWVLGREAAGTMRRD